MKKTENTSVRLTTLIFIFPLVALLLYGGLSHLFFFYTQQKEIKRELEKYEHTLMDIEKNTLKEKVENLTRFIRYYDSKSSDKIKKDAKNIVNLTVNIANNIYRKYKDITNEVTLKKMIKNALSNIKFEGDLGYLFVLDMKGNVYVHIDPKIVGTNIMNIRDVNGKYIVKEFTKVLQEKGEGFVDYYWYISSEDRKQMHYKISYVKLLECYDWYVGAGEYLKYMKRDVRKDMLAYIKDNSSFMKGYFFISNSQNQIIYSPYDNNISGHTWKELNQFRLEDIYQDDQYMAYTDYVAEYDWYITAVKELKEIQLNIDFKKKQSESKREENVRTNLYLMLFSWFISLLLSLYLSKVINYRLKNYESRLKETNEKLVFQSRQALLGELLPMIAHQWRQPINKIASIMALLRFSLTEKKIDAKKIDVYYQDIEDSIEFMSDTIDDFRTFYQPKENASMVNLKELINKSIEYVGGSIRKKDIQVHKVLEDIEFKLYANEFLQVMINLIKNAVDSLDQRGEINIRLFKKEEEIIISVEDNGTGIDIGALKKIFDPYFTTKEDSMGLGLYMTKIIIEKHMKGTIEVQKLTQGTKFTIHLY